MSFQLSRPANCPHPPRVHIVIHGQWACLVPRKQVLTARSTLELPPIIKHQDGHHLAFLHPCLRTSPSEAGALEASSPSTSDTKVFLDLRCSFNTNGGSKRERPNLEVGNAPATAPGVPRPPPSETNLLRGGVLCIQVRREAYVRMCHIQTSSSYGTYVCTVSHDALSQQKTMCFAT